MNTLKQWFSDNFDMVIFLLGIALILAVFAVGLAIISIYATL